MRQHPALALGFLIAVFAQGCLQGLLIWTIKNVLVVAEQRPTRRAKPYDRGSRADLCDLAAQGSDGFCRGLSFDSPGDARRARRNVRGAGKPVGTADRLLRSPHARRSRHGVVSRSQGLRACTVEVGRHVLYLSQVAGLAVAAVILSPGLALIGMLTVPLGAVPA